MLKMIVDRQILIILPGLFTALGVISKIVVNAVLSRMVRAAGNMSKSDHPLMRLMRAKFEHACMVSEKVENVQVFVDKYLYEYHVFGVRFHSIRRLENASALLCIVTGLLGSALTYAEYGMSDQTLRTGIIGVGLGILVYVFHLTTDENYRMQIARNYMVDYLQNVCLHRYEKAYRKEAKGKETVRGQEREPDEEDFEEEDFEEAGVLPELRPETRKQSELRPEIRQQSELRPETKPRPETVSFSDAALPIQGTGNQAVCAKGAEEQLSHLFRERKQTEKEQEEPGKEDEKEIRIRRILEEFMA